MMRQQDAIFCELRIAAIDCFADFVAVAGSTRFQKDIIRLFKQTDNSFHVYDSVELEGPENLHRCIAYNCNGKRLATTDHGRRMTIFQSPELNKLITMTGDNEIIYDIAWFPNGNFLVSGGDRGVVNLWSLRGSTTSLSGQAEKICSVSVSMTGYFIASASKDGSVYIWDSEERDSPLAVVYGFSADPVCVAFNPVDEHLLLISTTDTFMFYNVRRKEKTPATEYSSRGVCWTLDGTGFFTHEMSCISLWDYVDQTIIARYKKPSDSIFYIFYKVCMMTDGNAFIANLSRNHVDVIRLPWFFNVILNAAEINKRCLLHKFLLAPTHYVTFEQLLSIDGVDVDAVDDEGDTALHIAVNQDNKRAIRALLRKGASQDIVNNAGRLAEAPVDPMSQKTINRTRKTLHWYNYISPDTLTADDVNDFALLQKMIEEPKDDFLTLNQVLEIHGVNLELADEHGQTPLNVARTCKRREAIDALITAGANDVAAGPGELAPINEMQHVATRGRRSALPAELWGLIVSDYLPMSSIDKFRQVCKSFQVLVSDARCSYQKVILIKRGISAIVAMQHFNALEGYVDRHEKQMGDVLQSLKLGDWDTALQLWSSRSSTENGEAMSRQEKKRRDRIIEIVKQHIGKLQKILKLAQSVQWLDGQQFLQQKIDQLQ